jgi:hypothetical protein
MSPNFLDVRVDASSAIALLTLGKKRLDYASVNAVNSTAKRVQAAEKEQVGRAFTLRDKRSFIERQAAIIKPFASVPANRYFAQISVGQKPGLLLSSFEAGGARPRTSPLPSKGVAVPVTGGPARPSRTSPVPSSFRLANLRIIRVQGGSVVRTASGRSKRDRASVDFSTHTTSGGAVQLKGTRRTFILTSTSRAPFGGVYQRIGPGRGDIRMIYSFARGLRLDASLRFVVTAKHTTDRYFAHEVQREVAAAFAFRAGRTA